MDVLYNKWMSYIINGYPIFVSDNFILVGVDNL